MKNPLHYLRTEYDCALPPDAVVNLRSNRGIELAPIYVDG